MMALLLVLMIARTTVVEADRFQRLTATAVLSGIAITAVLFVPGLLLISAAIPGTIRHRHPPRQGRQSSQAPDDAPGDMCTTTALPVAHGATWTRRSSRSCSTSRPRR